MTEKEIAEIRRRFRTDKSNISHVCGCLVNEKKEIISEFDQSLGMMPEDDADSMLRILKKTLSGAHGRNLIDIEFSTQQVMESEEHKLLSDIRHTQLKDGELVHKLYDKIINSYETDGSYLILLAYDCYDVFAINADGEKDTESSKVFNYFLCSVCPAKAGKATLSYYFPGKCFRTVAADTVLGAPELGFMFPAFDDRAANIYGALYYTKKLNDSHEATVEALFNSPLPMPAATQKEIFSQILEETAGEDCSMRMVRTVHSQICNMLEEHKAEKIEEPPVLTKDDVGEMLRYSGVPEEKVEKFSERYDEEFGKDARLNPKNIADSKSITVKTPEMSVKVAAGHSNVLETRIIDGVKYILIRADGEVEVNGVNIHI
ncbi:MAG: DUF4317 domain-containing protein [Clostridia bacterium]|nr:DUF4317 domain-containing protein [Clostridia bacterium]